MRRREKSPLGELGFPRVSASGKMVLFARSTIRHPFGRASAERDAEDPFYRNELNYTLKLFLGRSSLCTQRPRPLTLAPAG